MELIRGNAILEGASTRGWFVGAFIDSNSGLVKNGDVEVKWGIHPKGEKRTSKADSGDATTLSILIQGEYAIRFNDEEIVLRKAGDYIIFMPNQPHDLEALEDTVIITVRWPSLSSNKN